MNQMHATIDFSCEEGSFGYFSFYSDVVCSQRETIELELRYPHNVNGFTVDPKPEWSFDSLVSELDKIGKKPFYKKQLKKLRASKENYCGIGGFVMNVSDHESGFSSSDIEEELHISDGFDHELPINSLCFLMNKMALSDGALHELSHEFQLYVMEEARNKISTLETDLIKENEKFASQIAEIGKLRKTQQEKKRRFDLLYQRAIVEAVDNRLAAVQKDYEHISEIEEKRIRDDAAREEAKRKEKILIEEKIRQQRIKAEEEAKLQAERTEIAKAVGEAEKRAVEENKQIEKQAVEAATTESAVEILRDGVHKGNRRIGKDFDRLIKTISATVENVRTKADELVTLINSPECQQSINILSFAEKVVSNCENSQKSNGYIFACSRVTVLVTSKIPLALEILTEELNKVCMYTVPKFVEYSPVLLQTREAYFKAIGYKEIDGKMESTDSYLERLGSNMRLYGALVQTEIGGFENPLGLEKGWAWLARFLNSLPANLYTAVALQHFLEMSGYALYRRYRNQFEKSLRIIARDFLKALKEGNSDSVNAKVIKVKTSIVNYIESSQFKKEPEGLQLRVALDSNDFF